MLQLQINVALMSCVYCCFTLHVVNAALEILKGMANLANIVHEHVKFDIFANKFKSKNVRGMFVHTQNIFSNICCSMECCLIWPLCSRTIQLSQVKVARELCENHLSRLLLEGV